MRTSDFDYLLPPDRIAQRPASPRDHSRMLVLQRPTGQIEHRNFRELPEFLRSGDALVINETRVIPGRLKAHKLPGGGKVELLLLREVDPTTWEALVGGKGLSPGRSVRIQDGPSATILQDLGGPRRLVEFSEPISPLLDQIGEMPLPPYIKTPLRNHEEYQTTFARQPGSAAAPTAGLHFTDEILAQVKARGVEILRITLHVGLDTFAPVTEQDPQTHPIHTEWCSLDPHVAQSINQIKQRGGRIFAVGTTCVRTLETAASASPSDQIVAFEGPTALFIIPGFQFQLVDAMLTNFHLPRSTLLMLVSAFSGREQILHAYAQAIEHGYRFYSFGDAMLIV
ncbi:MAG: tRNA preQ1(34) S-adenosylmethionine ribosyltransferase-isomerase QueA [Anaerolineales bacterium]|nr:MAG: tRNA preQ1(34) S-adenosylmethionine ribosyltransferase-isomerase QueA [Anaerolineales bacterium]